MQKTAVYQPQNLPAARVSPFAAKGQTYHEENCAEKKHGIEQKRSNKYHNTITIATGRMAQVKAALQKLSGKLKDDYKQKHKYKFGHYKLAAKCPC